jgi:hypothetical protein
MTRSGHVQAKIKTKKISLHYRECEEGIWWRKEKGAGRLMVKLP